MIPCPTDTRITVYSTNNPKASRDLCPSGPDVVAFSDGWDSIHQFNPIEISKNLVIEFRIPRQSDNGIQANDYRVTWMEIFPNIDCAHKCTELQACIAPNLWCDGKVHCPSGQDEEPLVCDAQPPLSPIHVGLTAALFTIFLSLLAGLTACVRRKRVEKNFRSNQIDLNININLSNSPGTYSARYHHRHHHRHHRFPAHPAVHENSISPLYLDSHKKKSC